MPATEPEKEAPAPDSAPNALRPLPPGERYRLGVELGRGGMGRVVEAFDVQLGRTVALKEVLPTLSGTPRRFAREVQITARLEHPAIVPLYDAGVNPDGRPFYVMRRVSGRPLDELLRRARSLDERLVLLPAVLAAIDAIAHAHKRGVIHRDLKPANILVGDLGETVVIDWGLAKVIGEPDEIAGTAELAAGDSLQTQFGSVFGTPGFMSPEQARGEELGPEGDVYALGATLYQLLAGKPPHSGTSATEILDSTHRNKVVPLGTISPDAPAELVAIVDKALAFTAEERYANATQLSADVRRFLTGQLVAAHRYTRRQRISRFARKNRAPLVVAALASVAVAVLAWIGVHSIMTERDAATSARAEAVTNLRAAEESRDREADRAEALVALRARSLLDDSPTEALAVLKQIATSKKQATEVRVIAQAAIMRGVAWALEGPDSMTMALEMSPDATHAAQLVRDGTLDIWDLDHRRLVLAKRLAKGSSHIAYVANGTLLLVYGSDAPALLDPVTGALSALATRPISRVASTRAGDRVIAIDDQKTAVVIDIAARTVTPVSPGRKVTDVAIAPDGAWSALVDDKGVTVIDRAGAELTRFAGSVHHVVVGPGRLAIDVGTVHEFRVAPGATWTTIPLADAPRVMQLFYRDRGELVVVAMGLEVTLWDGATLRTSYRIPDLVNGAVMVANDVMVFPSTEGKMRYIEGGLSGELRLPSELIHPRFAGRTDKHRLIAAGDGIVVGYDLDQVLPRVLVDPPQSDALFIDDDTILIHGMMPEWSWYDLRTDQQISFEVIPHGLVALADADPTTGRVVLEESGPGGRVIVLHKNQKTLDVVDDSGKDPIARFLPGGPLLYGLSDGRVLAAFDGKSGRELVKLDGAIVGLATVAPGLYFAISARGEIVRGDLTTGRLERLRVTPDATLFVAASVDHALIVQGDRLQTWVGAAIEEVAQFDMAIELVSIADRGAVITLHDHSVYWLDLQTKRVDRLMSPLASPLTMSHDGQTIAGLAKAGQITMMELPSRSRWTLPSVVVQTIVHHVSPHRHAIVGSSGRTVLVWRIPQVGADLAAALDGLTNASEDPGNVLVWPWQHAPIQP